MAFGKRLRFFRNRKGLTQKQVGETVGFQGKTSEVRMAQYETEARTPKDALVKQLADLYGISPKAITVPDIDSEVGLMHTLFALEDMYGLRIDTIDDVPCLTLDHGKSNTYIRMLEFFEQWQGMSAKVKSGEITAEEYDNWRYNYSSEDTPGIHVKNLARVLDLK